MKRTHFEYQIIVFKTPKKNLIKKLIFGLSENTIQDVRNPPVGKLNFCLLNIFTRNHTQKMRDSEKKQSKTAK